MTGEPAENIPPSQRERLREVALVFTKLGFTAFGGPAAHVALMEDEFVHRRKWLDRQHFLDLLSAVNFIPGPNSTELAIHLGLIRAGIPGLIVAGVCFIFPAVLIILPIAYFYVQYGALPQATSAMRGVSIAMTAIVVVATWRLFKGCGKSGWNIGIIFGSTIAWFLLRYFKLPQPDLLILAAAGVIGAMRYWAGRNIHLRLPCIAPLAVLIIDDSRGITQTFLFFLKIGATLFGSGYVLVTYLQTGLVDGKQWLTQQQMLDAIAVGQFTPGPLLTTATFIGYVLGATRFGDTIAHGILFGMCATVAIFLPAFILIALLAAVLDKLRRHPPSRAVFDALNDAVIGLLIATSLQLMTAVMQGTSSAGTAWLGGLLMAVSVAALLRNINSIWVLLAAGLTGLCIQWVT